ncbi:type II toxin-antitoxin system VapC family toxin [Occultella glacieicola]|uniref:Type II toxin-antitoxin system VapC family toxin n=1 Tax=Occultella glacieicola TaxID=2518684 RepID=A0ABY2EAK7_9MICO|nr:type II toxin-antitoxin system VapC family toxin [Occultella glacieicola]TDE99114.1 type II toxin-antitoxin system VapC family toxin [Occultella glacieicola]
MLLDTHVVLWLTADDGRLGSSARQQIAGSGAVLISAASLWEIAIKAELGKLGVPDDLPERLDRSGLRWLPVTAAHSWATRDVRGLPHRDPFDRLLVAQAVSEGVPLLTADAALLTAHLEPAVTLIDARR